MGLYSITVSNSLIHIETERLENIRMRKSKMTRGKFAALVVASCMAVAVPVLAFDSTYPYNIAGTNSVTISQFAPKASTIYFNSRPASGGDLHVTLSGAASGGATFPYYTSRTPWKVSVASPQSILNVQGEGTSSRGTAGLLHIWSN